jgi:uncharacterized protein (TIGR00369 family)
MARVESESRQRFRRVEKIFTDAVFIGHLGIKLDKVGKGWCEASLDVSGSHAQQHGFVHAGVLTTLADNSCGGAARAAVGAKEDVITVEFKINFLRPAKGRRLSAHGPHRAGGEERRGHRIGGVFARRRGEAAGSEMLVHAGGDPATLILQR